MAQQYEAHVADIEALASNLIALKGISYTQIVLALYSFVNITANEIGIEGATTIAKQLCTGLYGMGKLTQKEHNEIGDDIVMFMRKHAQHAEQDNGSTKT